LRYIVSYTREPASRKSATNDVVTAAFCFLFTLPYFVEVHSHIGLSVSKRLCIQETHVTVAIGFRYRSNIWL
jgi:hypothetical protein